MVQEMQVIHRVWDGREIGAYSGHYIEKGKLRLYRQTATAVRQTDTDTTLTGTAQTDIF